jgi:hypothetical protein
MAKPVEQGMNEQTSVDADLGQGSSTQPLSPSQIQTNQRLGRLYFWGIALIMILFLMTYCLVVVSKLPKLKSQSGLSKNRPKQTPRSPAPPVSPGLGSHPAPSR